MEPAAHTEPEIHRLVLPVFILGIYMGNFPQKVLNSPLPKIAPIMHQKSLFGDQKSQKFPLPTPLSLIHI